MSKDEAKVHSMLLEKDEEVVRDIKEMFVKKNTTPTDLKQLREKLDEWAEISKQLTRLRSRQSIRFA